MIEQEDDDWPLARVLLFAKQDGIPIYMQDEILKAAVNLDLKVEYREEAFRLLKYVDDADKRNQIALKGLEDNEYGVRDESSEILGLKAVPRLIEFLSSSKQELRLSGVASLGRILTRSYDIIAVEPLALALNDPSFGIWSNALRSLNKMLEWYSDEIDFGDIILGILLNHEKVSNTDLIPSEDGWNNSNQVSYADVFFESLSDLKIESMRTLNCQLLVDYMIEKGLTSNSGTVRRYSWYFLANNKIKTVPEDMILLGLNDKHPNVKKNAMQYLSVVPSDNFVPHLIENLNDNKKFTTGLGVLETDTTMRVASYQSLAYMGAIENLELLINVYDDLDDYDRFQVLPHLASAPWPSLAKIEVSKLFRREIERGKTENMLGEFREKFFDKIQSLQDRAIAALNHLENN